MGAIFLLNPRFFKDIFVIKVHKGGEDKMAVISLLIPKIEIHRACNTSGLKKQVVTVWMVLEAKTSKTIFMKNMNEATVVFVYTHFYRENIEFNLSVVRIQECHENSSRL